MEREEEVLIMKRMVEELLELASDMNRMLSPSDKLSELIEATMARYGADELWEEDLDLVAAAGKVPDNPTNRLNHK